MSNPNKNEILFLETMANKNKTYIYHPSWFTFSNGKKYMPDFYCKEDDEYIEISGTRQAYHANKSKYKRFAKEFKNINFKIIHIWKLNGIKKVIDQLPNNEISKLAILDYITHRKE